MAKKQTAREAAEKFAQKVFGDTGVWASGEAKRWFMRGVAWARRQGRKKPKTK